MLQTEPLMTSRNNGEPLRMRCIGTLRRRLFQARSVTYHEASLTKDFIAAWDGTITPGGFSQRLWCVTAISLRDYQRRRQLDREALCLQFIEMGYWCLLCLWWIVVLVKGFLEQRPTLLLSFEPYDIGIQRSKTHLDMGHEKCIRTYDAPCIIGQCEP